MMKVIIFIRVREVKARLSSRLDPHFLCSTRSSAAPLFPALQLSVFLRELLTHCCSTCCNWSVMDRIWYLVHISTARLLLLLLPLLLLCPAKPNLEDRGMPGKGGGISFPRSPLSEDLVKTQTNKRHQICKRQTASCTTSIPGTYHHTTAVVLVPGTWYQIRARKPNCTAVQQYVLTPYP